MTPEEAERAVQYLVDSAFPYAKAKARQTKAHAMLRHVKALAMKASGEMVVSAQERNAYASDEYKSAIDEEYEATLEFGKIQAAREAARVRVDFWRSLEASRREAGV